VVDLTLCDYVLDHFWGWEIAYLTARFCGAFERFIVEMGEDSSLDLDWEIEEGHSEG
jgi:hypothetical protein